MLPLDCSLGKLMAVFGTNICNIWGKNAQTCNIITNNDTCLWIEKNEVSSMPMWNRVVIECFLRSPILFWDSKKNSQTYK